MQRNVVVSVLEAQLPGAEHTVKRVLKAGGLVEFDGLEKEAQDESVDLGDGGEERRGGVED